MSTLVPISQIPLEMIIVTLMQMIDSCGSEDVAVGKGQLFNLDIGP